MPISAPAVAATGVAVLNQTGQFVSATVTGGTVQGILATSPTLPAVATPAVPASTVTATNTNPFPVAVAVTGGTTTHIAINGSDQGTTTPFTAVVPAGGTIAITYSVAPTWTWTPLWAGIAGSPVASPLSFPVPPGGSISLVYTVAPTWVWSNPIDVGYTPGYLYPNMNGQTGIDYNTQLPFTRHNTLGQGNLAAAISN